MAGGATFTQNHFRWYADDAALGPDETSLATEDVNPNLRASVNYRLRLLVACTSGSGSIAAALQTRMDGGSWGTIGAAGATNPFLADSPYFVNFAALSQSLLTPVGSFSVGEALDTIATSHSVSLASGYYREWEWCFQFGVAGVGHTFEFRATNAGLAIAYLVTPQVTITSPRRRRLLIGV